MALTPFEQARQLLPKVPTDVFDIWLAPLIESNGWPFGLDINASPGDRWHGYFTKLPLRLISLLNWKRENLSGDFASFEPGTIDFVTALKVEYARGVQMLRNPVLNGKTRFERAFEYISVNRVLPKPVVLIKGFNGHRIMDGNHRLAALLHTGFAHCVTFDAWVGSLHIPKLQ